MKNALLFGREIVVTVDTIRLGGLDCAFSIEKTIKPEPNTCELTIWNLHDDHRAQLESIVPRKVRQATVGIPCRIEAGYRDNTSVIWQGDLRTVESTFVQPDWVTTLTSGDGAKAWKHARFHVSYGPKTPIETALRAMARALGVGEGNLSKVVSRLKVAGSAIFPTGKVYSGSVSRELVELARSADLEVSVQDGALQFIDRGKALQGTALRLAPETGLVESPSIDNEGILSAKTLLIPDLRVGGTVVLDTRQVRGAYKVTKAVWSGDTSAADWYITIEGEPL